jgi:ankyrin repeat protein
MHAVEGGHLNIVNSLLTRGADPNHKDSEMKTAYLTLVEMLDKGTPVKYHNKIMVLLNMFGGACNNEDTAKIELAPTPPVGLSADGKCLPVEVAKMTRTYEAYIGQNDTDKKFIEKAKSGKIEEVDALLSSDGANPNAVDAWGKPVLIVALMRGHGEVAKLLINNGADVNAGHEDLYPLTIAAHCGMKNVVELMLKHGADPYMAKAALMLPSVTGVPYPLRKSQIDAGIQSMLDDAKSKWPERAAVNYPAERAAAFLRKMGAVVIMPHQKLSPSDIGNILVILEENNAITKARPNAEQRRLDSQLFYALRDAEFTNVKRCLDAGADVNAMDEYGVTPLMHAISKKDLELLQLFLNSEPDLNMQNSGGFTALMRAVQEGNMEFVKRLLDAGASTLITDNEGTTALEIANICSHGDIAGLLRQHDDKVE